MVKSNVCTKNCKSAISVDSQSVPLFANFVSKFFSEQILFSDAFGLCVLASSNAFSKFGKKSFVYLFIGILGCVDDKGHFALRKRFWSNKTF